MEPSLRAEIEQFVEQNIAKFHSDRLRILEKLSLKQLLDAKNPYLFRAKNMGSVDSLIQALLDARLSSSEEGIFGTFLEELAVFVSSKTCNGQKSPAPGLDIDLTRDGIRYLIAVKSGKNWGNSSQHSRLKGYFDTAVKVLRQSAFTGHVQPTLGICYGRFRTVPGQMLKIGGQSFWHLISGDRELYKTIIVPLGHQAKQRNEAFEEQRTSVQNRLVREFSLAYCREDGSIDWEKLVERVSKNMAD